MHGLGRIKDLLHWGNYFYITFIYIYKRKFEREIVVHGIVKFPEYFLLYSIVESINNKHFQISILSDNYYSATPAAGLTRFG